MITTRDLFNYLNPARIYSKWLKDQGLSDRQLDPHHPCYMPLELHLAAGQPLAGNILKGDKDE